MKRRDALRVIGGSLLLSGLPRVGLTNEPTVTVGAETRKITQWDKSREIIEIDKPFQFKPGIIRWWYGTKDNQVLIWPHKEQP